MTGFDASFAVNQVTNALTRGALAAPLKSLDSFINKISTTTSIARAAGNSVAKEDVLQRLASRGDPALSLDWIGLILDPTVSTTNQLPWYFIDSIATPSLSIGSEEWFINGKVRKFAKGFSLQQVNVKVYSDVNGVGFNFANAWARSTLREDGYWNLPNKYKKDIQLFILDPTRTIIVDFRLIGCWVTSWASYPLDSNASILETDLTLEVDDLFMNYDSDFTAAKSVLNDLATSGINSAIAGATQIVGNTVKSALGSVFGSNTGFNLL